MHLHFLPSCGFCFVESVADGKGGRLQHLSCPECSRELVGIEAERFQHDVEEHFEKHLERRAEYRSQGLPYPYEISAFSLHYKPESGKGFEAQYGYLLPS